MEANSMESPKRRQVASADSWPNARLCWWTSEGECSAFLPYLLIVAIIVIVEALHFKGKVKNEKNADGSTLCMQKCNWKLPSANFGLMFPGQALSFSLLTAVDLIFRSAVREKKCNMLVLSWV